MKLPSFNDLSKEQDKIYNLPLDKNYLVSGPPGTGKTVVALYRASMYKNMGKRPTVLAYNKLLSSYTGDAAEELDINSNVNTYHSWVGSTYYRHFKIKAPVKAPFVYDWDKILPELYKKLESNKPIFLIDEGQDLPKEFYTAAAMITENMTVFADENQRITDTQSTFSDIRHSAMIVDEHQLTRNYRNTLEIAQVAKQFYSGLPSGVPVLPERRGPKPVVQNTKDLDQAIDLIVRHERNFPQDQIGVFTKSKDFMRTVVNRLSGRTRHPVESYDTDNDRMPSFDTPGVKVITYASAKGLEFDAVFIPEIQGIRMPMEVPENRMAFYVLLSRARERLYLLYSGQGKPTFFNLIPQELVQEK